MKSKILLLVLHGHTQTFSKEKKQVNFGPFHFQQTSVHATDLQKYDVIYWTSRSDWIVREDEEGKVL